MDPIQEKFQKELISKLQNKCSSRIGIENALLKIFKFFDLENSGSLRKLDFLRAIAKASVVISDENIADHLFKIYSNDSNSVNYKDFIINLTQNTPQGSINEPKNYPQVETHQDSPSKDLESRPSQKILDRTPVRQPEFDVISHTSKAQSQRPQEIQQSPPDNQSISSSSTRSRQVELIVQRIKNRLATRGARGFISIYRTFRSLDLDKDGFLSLNEFRKAIRDHRIDVTDSEVDIIFSYFDRDRTGVVDLWGIMFVFKGELGIQRQQLVEQVFEKIDTDNDQFVSYSQIKTAFQVRNHPDVKSGKKQDDEVLNDFMESIKMLHLLNGGFGNEQVSKDEFLEFFTNYSAAIPDDKYFEAILFQVFKLGNDSGLQNFYAGGKRAFDPDHKKGYLQDHHRYVVSGGSVSQNAPFGTFNEPTQYPQAERPSTRQAQGALNIFQGYVEDNGKNQNFKPEPQQVVQQKPTYENNVRDILGPLRNKVLARGLRGFISIQKKLRFYDKQNTGILNLNSFQRVLNDLKLFLTEREITDIYREYETPQRTGISYDLLIKTLQGTMTQNKFIAIQAAYENFPKDRSGNVKFEDIRNSYNGRNHPDVRGNKRKEEDIVEEFLDTFEDNHILYTGDDYLINPIVTFEEFICYYNNFNPLIQDDVYFELAISSVFPNKGQRKY